MWLGCMWSWLEKRHVRIRFKKRKTRLCQCIFCPSFYLSLFFHRVDEGEVMDKYSFNNFAPTPKDKNIEFHIRLQHTFPFSS
mmetsp:Transcript_11731/g.17087  ORF Transcript_11731/g.17087 Transcript_11731/m.17087 type:complete len:82 (+) Transcript_11731:438-683(+)